jgi:hypothetical protein
MYLDELLRLNKEILGWLSVQKGMIPKDYAKDLARLLSRVEEEQKCRTTSDSK